MNTFKLGDRVIFLNEKGGGVVTKIIDQQIVHVSIEEGFEIPYAVKDLLKSGGGDAAGSGPHAGSAGEPDNPDMKPLHVIQNKHNQLAEGVYMAYIPEDQEELLRSRLEIALVNHSSYQVHYVLFQNLSGIFHGLDYGIIDPYSLLAICSIDRNQIEEWANGMVQLLFYKDGKTDIMKPASVTIDLKPVKIYKENSFVYESLIRRFAMLIELANIDKQARKLVRDEPDEDKLKQLEELSFFNQSTKKNEPKRQGFLERHKVDDRIAEVDLHISELTDQLSNLSNMDILRIQMDYFRKCMDEAQIEKLKKIIFIHGVGNGTLKNEILRFLRQTEGMEFYDAPYARYGMGATEVLFYRNR